MKVEIAKSKMIQSTATGDSGLTKSQEGLVRHSRLRVRVANKNIFLGETVHVEVFLVSGQTNDLVKVRSSSMKVFLKDEYNDELELGPGNLALESERGANVELVDGVCRFSFKLGPNVKLAGNTVAVHVDAQVADVSIPPASSELMTICSALLEVVADPPTKWYKDEGGKGNCITLNVRLKGPAGEGLPEEGGPAARARPAAQEVPLFVALLYEDGKAVGQQGILQLARDSRLAVGPGAPATLRFRVGEVSQRHQGQRFRIRVQATPPRPGAAPPGAAVFSRVAPVDSAPFTVLSKRKKRHRVGEPLPPPRPTPGTLAPAPALVPEPGTDGEMEPEEDFFEEGFAGSGLAPPSSKKARCAPPPLGPTSPGDESGTASPLLPADYLSLASNMLPEEGRQSRGGSPSAGKPPLHPSGAWRGAGGAVGGDAGAAAAAAAAAARGGGPGAS